jgi:hypothetical protein
MTRIRDSSMGVAMGYGLIPDNSRFFSSPQLPDGLWGPPSLLANGHRGEFTEGKRLRSEADDSSPPSAEIKNGGAIPPLPHMSS